MVPRSNPVAGQPGWGFSGFLNLKIGKKLVIFKGKCRVGPHVPRLLIQINVYCFSWSETIIVKWWTSNAQVPPTDGSVLWTHTVAHRWGCLISWLISSDVARWLHWTRPDTCLITIDGVASRRGRGPVTTLDTAQCLPWIREKSHVWLLRFNISI